jgi:23S rRNA pseudouridine2605 synthase
VFDHLPADLPRVVSVGRLDLNSEGLLLLTNDGELAQHLAHPSTGWTRKYRVRVFGKVDEKRLRALKDGITVKDVHYKSIEAKLEGKPEGMNSWISVSLREGKNREIRKVMAALGLEVNRLIRVSYGPFNLDKLAVGAAREIESKVLQAQLAGYFKGRGA